MTSLTLYDDCRLTLLAAPQFAEADHLPVEWAGQATDGERLCEYAGRICYMSQHNPAGRTTAEYLANIKAHLHGSVLEHANYTFLLEQVSRSLTHELVRHRAGFAYCLAGDTEVYSSTRESGRFDGVKKRWTLRQLYEWSQDPKRKGSLKLIRLRSYDGVGFVPGAIKAIAESGVKDIVRVTLADGKTIRCSADHRFLGADGVWVAVRDFGTRQKLAVNGHSPATREKLRRQKLGSKNPAWRGDAASQRAGRLRAQRLYSVAGRCCEICGSEQRIHRHHKDGNTLNNAQDNIALLCATCHQAEHHIGRRMSAKYVEVVSVVPDGREMTYDIEMLGEYPNFVANGIVTHNSQLSQRYVDESAVGFVVPPALLMAGRQSAAYKQFAQQAREALASYQALSEQLMQQYAHVADKVHRRKMAREAARSVLPNATETKLVVTANVRAWRTMLELRSGEGADAEIRRYACKQLQWFKANTPAFFADVEVYTAADGNPAARFSHRKV